MKMYRVFPDFLRQREQRVGGLLTVPQVAVGMFGIIFLIVAVRIEFLLVIPAALLIGLAMLAASPVEGELRITRWMIPLRMLVARQSFDNYKAFPSSRLKEPDAVPLVVRRGGRVVLATQVRPGADKKK